jgi:branched-chain amino acid transport system permease protein
VRFGAALVAALFIGLAGVFIGLMAGSVSPLMGAAAGLKGMVAMLIGGAGNLPGAVVGGLAVGVIESVSAQYVSSSFSGAAAFAVLFLVMVLKPSGLMKEY